ncbi:MAG TPA: ketoacyl-ACP synthase III [Candidatus Desulfofervidus auxilii]|uniref:Beta-ketoacyl-[acyl-carrier-protein] synthase III n=1 Tax=Desulfofervidus auxilii TaxID=1621989 RepID=A0A7V0IA63_DESA2|nr:ketoacyl-ACP synthase III [Candidatus Desulfofervidus auxilii]
MRAGILGTGSHLPKKKLTNHDLEKMVETSDEWITTRSGIKERRIVSGETWSFLATEASKKALEMAKVEPGELDLIIGATFTADYRLPAGACLVQENLKAYKAAAFDISAACTGFIYGLVIAEKFIKDTPTTKALVIGAEVLSSVTNWKDRSTCVLFGDGAGAAVIGKVKKERGIIASCIKSDPQVWDLLCVLGGGSAYPPRNNEIPDEEYYVKMKGHEVFKYAVRHMVEVARTVIEMANISVNKIDWLIPHQANIRIINMVAQKLGIPIEKVYINLQKYGNTSAATVPIALDEAVREGAIKPGHLILLDAFGGGFTYGAVLIRW